MTDELVLILVKAISRYIGNEHVNNHVNAILENVVISDSDLNSSPSHSPDLNTHLPITEALNRNQRSDLVSSVVESISVNHNSELKKHWLSIQVKDDLGIDVESVQEQLLIDVEKEVGSYLMQIGDWCKRSRDKETNLLMGSSCSTSNSAELFGDGGVTNNKWQLLNTTSTATDSFLLVSPLLTLNKRCLSSYQLYLREQVTRLHAAEWNDVQIARYFNEQGILTVRGKLFKANHVWSIRKKM